MTSTFAPITERIPLAPDFPGTVYTAGWTPRPDQQSPDLRPPTDEWAIVANRKVHEADDAETQAIIDLATPAVVLADVMPQPHARPKRYRGRRRAAAPPWLSAVLAFAGGLVGGVTVLTAAVIQAGALR